MGETPAPRYRVERITPAKAARMLEKNTDNRKEKNKHQAAWARTMTAGKWRVGNDAVCVAVDGTLLNGQNRLGAVVMSGCTVDMLVGRNIPLDDRDSMDSGVKRSPGDVLHLRGHKQATIVAAAAKLLMDLSDGTAAHNNVRTTDEVLAFADNWPVLHDSAVTAHRAYQRGTAASQAVLATAHFLIALENGAALADFYLDQVSEPFNEPRGSAAIAVGNRLSQIRRAREKHPRHHLVALLLKGWNAYAQNKPVERFSVSPRSGAEFRLPRVEKWARETPWTEEAAK